MRLCGSEIHGRVGCQRYIGDTGDIERAGRLRDDRDAESCRNQRDERRRLGGFVSNVGHEIGGCAQARDYLPHHRTALADMDDETVVAQLRDLDLAVRGEGVAVGYHRDQPVVANRFDFEIGDVTSRAEQREVDFAGSKGCDLCRREADLSISKYWMSGIPSNA